MGWVRVRVGGMEGMKWRGEGGVRKESDPATGS